MSLSTDLIFDPYGDVLLVLSRTVVEDTAESSPEPAPAQDAADTESTVADTTETTPEPTSGQDVADTELVVADATAEHPTASNKVETPEVKKIEEFEVRVSSRHLALASKVFRVMFDGHFKERVDPGKEQPTRVPLPDDDPDAIMVLLNIIHGLNKRVQRSIEKPLFIAIAILVDKYELHEVVELCAEKWFEQLWAVRSFNPPHLTDWIFLCWVFGKATQFQQLSSTAIRKCGPKFEDNGLPFPQFVASK